MRINNSPKQTFEKDGILLKQPVFTHGHLHLGISRVSFFDDLRFYISKYNSQGPLANNERVFTENIHCTEVFNL